MKVIYFVLIILAVIALYSFIDEYVVTGNIFNSFRLVQTPIEEKPAPKTTYYAPSNPTPVNNKKIETPPVKPTTSSYIGKVKISGIQSASSYHPAMITLYISPYKGEAINLTGFKIKTRIGELIIKQGVEIYEPYPTARTNQDIIIKNNVTVYLITDDNPLGTNKNFRPNKCFGYLNNYKFYPSIYTSYCPKPALKDVSHLQPYCQEYILHIPSCSVPDYSNDVKIVFDMECRNFIDGVFNYRSCINNYSGDKDFFANNWYVYVNQNIVEPLHDTIYLYDQNGLPVDQYLY